MIIAKKAICKNKQNLKKVDTKLIKAVNQQITMISFLIG